MPKGKFKFMTTEQRDQWIKWCFRHDWCVSAGQDGCRRFFVETTDNETVFFEEPSELRAWAGY